MLITTVCTGCGLNDSPVGLAAYILEKFSTWTDPKNKDLDDGGLDRCKEFGRRSRLKNHHFSTLWLPTLEIWFLQEVHPGGPFDQRHDILDHALHRALHALLQGEFGWQLWQKGGCKVCGPYQKQLFHIPKDNTPPPPTCSIGVLVPSGLAAFPEELIHCPKAWADSKYYNIYSYTLMPRGGHFAAFEEPQLLAEDIFQFVRKVEKCWGCRCTETRRIVTWSVLYWLFGSTWRIHALMFAKTADQWCWHVLNCDLNKMEKIYSRALLTCFVLEILKKKFSHVIKFFLC